MRKRPFLGIAARRFASSAFGEQSSYLRGIIRLAGAAGMRGYVFRAEDVDWEYRRVWGWVPSGKGWRRRWFPFPDVIYDRAWGLDARARARHADALARFQDLGVPHFNPDFGDKLQVYRLLSAAPGVASHLPETLPLTPDNVAKLGARYDLLFVKPARGRQGKGICACRRAGPAWRLRKRTDEGTVVRTLPDEEALVRACVRGAEDEPFLVQQGLDLVRLKKGTVDIRVIAQRDALGRWRVSALGVRAGKPGGFVSNLHAGGRALSLTQLVRGARLKEPVGRLSRSIESLALAAASALSEAYPTLGELGIDVGLDVRGALWILEVNRQPGRALFSRARLRRAWRRSRLGVVRFARYLATRPEPADLRRAGAPAATPT